jgi:hypothetical protein
MRPKEYYATLPLMALLIDDGDNFVKLFAERESDMQELLLAFMEVGGTIVTTTSPNGLREYDAMTDVLKEAESGIALGNPNDQTTFEIYSRGSKADIEIGYLCGSGDPIKIKIPLVQKV